MAAISGVAWKTAQPFPQTHALRVRPRWLRREDSCSYKGMMYP